MEGKRRPICVMRGVSPRSGFLFRNDPLNALEG